MNIPLNQEMLLERRYDKTLSIIIKVLLELPLVEFLSLMHLSNINTSLFILLCNIFIISIKILIITVIPNKTITN